MYSFPQYKEHDHALIVQFMKDHPFVTMVAVDRNGRIEATHIPVLVDERDGKVFLTGHVAKKLSHEKALAENPDALIIFTGPHIYVTGTWYTGNLQTASTWNYISVHARGKINWMNEEELISLLKRLSLHFENYNTSSTTIYDNLPHSYLDKLVKAIVGFEMEVTELENVFKLSQDRDEKSYDNIVQQLKKQDGDGKILGELMERRKGKVFPG